MALTATQIANLNGASEANRQAALGTVLAAAEGVSSNIVVGTYTMVAGDASAGTVDIDTGLATADSAIVQIYRSGVGVFSDQAVSIAAGVITVADGGATYACTADDVVNYIVFAG